MPLNQRSESGSRHINHLCQAKMGYKVSISLKGVGRQLAWSGSSIRVFHLVWGHHKYLKVKGALFRDFKIKSVNQQSSQLHMRRISVMKEICNNRTGESGIRNSLFLSHIHRCVHDDYKSGYVRYDKKEKVTVRPEVVIWCYVSWPFSVQVMACCLFGVKPLSKPLLSIKHSEKKCTKIWMKIW